MSIIVGALAVGALLTAPVRAADSRSGVRGNSQPQAQPVSRQDAFLGQTQTRQNQFFSQPVFPQQPFNQNATILPPAYYVPMQLNYQGAPAGIIPGTGASFNPGSLSASPGFQVGFAVPPAITNTNASSMNPTSVPPMTTFSTRRQIQSPSSRQTFNQIMPRMGMLGRW
jgi:hypothetical protein